MLLPPGSFAPLREKVVVSKVGVLGPAAVPLTRFHESEYEPLPLSTVTVTAEVVAEQFPAPGLPQPPEMVVGEAEADIVAPPPANSCWMPIR